MSICGRWEFRVHPAAVACAAVASVDAALPDDVVAEVSGGPTEAKRGDASVGDGSSMDSTEDNGKNIFWHFMVK